MKIYLLLCILLVIIANPISAMENVEITCLASTREGTFDTQMTHAKIQYTKDTSARPILTITGLDGENRQLMEHQICNAYSDDNCFKNNSEKLLAGKLTGLSMGLQINNSGNGFFRYSFKIYQEYVPVWLQKTATLIVNLQQCSLSN